MTDKPQERQTDKPVGYQTQSVHRRMTRPLHARREAILAEAEAVFAKVRVDPESGDK